MVNLRNMLNNDMEDLGILDILNLWAVWAQYKGLKDADSDRDSNFIIMNAIANEIDLIHEELKTNIQQNNIIIEQNNALLEHIGNEGACAEKFKIPEKKKKSK